MKKRLVIGVSGASGVIYAIRFLEILRKINTVETHAVFTKAAETNIRIETEYTVDEVKKYCDFVHDASDLTSSICSGSFLTDGMVVIPCSMKSLSGIVHSYNDNLLIRAADVTLKEGRKLIVVPRETPLHKGHLEMMLKLVEYGGILIPPFPAFYHAPKTILDIIDHTLGKILDHLGIEHELFKRWD